MRRRRVPEAADMNTNKGKKTGFKDFVLSSCIKNHREHRVHREKQHCSVFSVCWYEKTDQLQPAKSGK
jgi:hypothetical protein